MRGKKKGVVYILGCEAISAWKIGCTYRSPEERVSDLSTTSAPSRFYIKHVSQPIYSYLEAEAEIHSILNNCRVSRNREFFYGDVSTLIEIVDEVVSDFSTGREVDSGKLKKLTIELRGDTLNNYELIYQHMVDNGIEGANQFVKLANCRRQEGLAWYKQRRAS